MKTYVVNLARSTERRAYMEQILKQYPQLDIEFIEAVDGRKLSDEEIVKTFDTKRFEHHYNKHVRPGEIGCTLSHQKCYKALWNSSEKSAIIFEDDLIINEDLTPLLPEIENWLNNDEPRLLLLSGWFWLTSSMPFDDNHTIAKAHDAFLTHSYALNRAACELMIDKYPFYTADAWNLIRKKGVKIYGLRPHLCDQDWSGVFKTVVNDVKEESCGLNFASWFRIKHQRLTQEFLKAIGKFEPAVYGK